MVAGELAMAGQLSTAAGNAVEVAFAAVVQFRGQAHRLAQQMVERDRPVFGGEVQFVVEQPPQFFVAFHAPQQQDIAAEGQLTCTKRLFCVIAMHGFLCLVFGRQSAVSNT